MSVRADVFGSLGASPPSGQPLDTPLSTLAVRKTYYPAFQQGGSFSTSAGDNDVSLGPITSVKSLLFRADTPCKLKLTSADGTAQIIPLDELVQIHCPNRPITAITINGAAAGSFTITGD